MKNLNGRIQKLERNCPPDLQALTDEELDAYIKRLNIPAWMLEMSDTELRAIVDA